MFPSHASLVGSRTCGTSLPRARLRSSSPLLPASAAFDLSSFPPVDIVPCVLRSSSNQRAPSPLPKRFTLVGETSPMVAPCHGGAHVLPSANTNGLLLGCTPGIASATLPPAMYRCDRECVRTKQNTDQPTMRMACVTGVPAAPMLLRRAASTTSVSEAPMSEVNGFAPEITVLPLPRSRAGRKSTALLISPAPQEVTVATTSLGCASSSPTRNREVPSSASPVRPVVTESPSFASFFHVQSSDAISSGSFSQWGPTSYGCRSPPLVENREVSDLPSSLFGLRDLSPVAQLQHAGSFGIDRAVRRDNHAIASASPNVDAQSSLDGEPLSSMNGKSRSSELCTGFLGTASSSLTLPLPRETPSYTRKNGDGWKSLSRHVSEVKCSVPMPMPGPRLSCGSSSTCQGGYLSRSIAQSVSTVDTVNLRVAPRCDDSLPRSPVSPTSVFASASASAAASLAFPSSRMQAPSCSVSSLGNSTPKDLEELSSHSRSTSYNEHQPHTQHGSSCSGALDEEFSATGFMAETAFAISDSRELTYRRELERQPPLIHHRKSPLPRLQLDVAVTSPPQNCDEGNCRHHGQCSVDDAGGTGRGVESSHFDTMRSWWSEAGTPFSPMSQKIVWTQNVEEESPLGESDVSVAQPMRLFLDPAVAESPVHSRPLVDAAAVMASEWTPGIVAKAVREVLERGTRPMHNPATSGSRLRRKSNEGVRDDGDREAELSRQSPVDVSANRPGGLCCSKHSSLLSRRRDGCNLKGLSATIFPTAADASASGVKSCAQRKLIMTAVSESLMLTSLHPIFLEDIVNAFQGPFQVTRNAEVIRQGSVAGREPGLYVLERGILDVHERRGGTDSLGARVFTYDQPGQSFGELALFDGCTRDATIIARCDATVWWIDRRTFNECIRAARYLELLEPLEVMQMLTPTQLRQVAVVLQPRACHAGESIMRVGDKRDECFIVEVGSAVEIVDGRQVRSYGKGQVFGEAALLTGGHLAATANFIATSTPTKVAVLSGTFFRRVLGPAEGDFRSD
eukprot:TRINITY_DN42949_c0_g1_i1.p1 TRINITY_DN42949_c0_g1~~TRINITY_DN42949_c0_g1_i1.p1  ORF type:complete len:1023 (-),score=115.57 TRINITY_DN42949_c0_g1_i1:193-3261(-)